MTIEIGQFTFGGPFDSPESLQDKPGIWAVHDWVNKGFYLLDLGESDRVKSGVESHPRRDQWARRARGSLIYSVLYKPDASQEARRAIVSEISAATPPASRAWA